MNTDLIQKLIAEYKGDFARNDADERYKWIAVQCFQNNWNPDAPNFAEMLKNATAKSANLLDSYNVFARGMILEYAGKFPEETKKWFLELFDETQPLKERLLRANANIEQLNRRYYAPEPAKAHYQDLHAISVYLCFRYPEKYYIYKRREFAGFAKAFGFAEIPKQGSIDSLPVYFKMADQLHDLISADEELKQMSAARLNSDCYPDAEFRLLTQDLIHFYNDTKGEKDTEMSKDAENNPLPPVPTVPAFNRQDIPLALNTIFYGPPGTGKTHKLMVEIAKKYFSSLEQLDSVIKDKDKILAWWEVVALVLLDCDMPKQVTEIQTHPLILRRLIFSDNSHIYSTIIGLLQMHTKNDCSNVNYTTRQSPQIFWKNKDKSWTIDKELLKKKRPDLLEKLKIYQSWQPIKRYELVTFHQSFCYENFVEGLCAETKDGHISYKVNEGIFLKICAQARQNQAQPYALFIDEINRGNVSGIFGELISLIEENKREGAAEALPVALPYSRNTFSVPPNLFIIGSMNTADRSIDALDSALRRRFAFVEVPPQPELLSQEPWKPNHLSINLSELLESINQRVEFLLDRDHRIGHSYLMKVRGDSQEKELSNLRRVFRDQIIPLLEDYFYENLEKVAMVLGAKFIKKGATLNANCLLENNDTADFPEKTIRKVADLSALSEEDFNSLIKK